MEDIVGKVASLLSENHLFVVLVLMMTYKFVSYIIDKILQKIDDSRYKEKIQNRMAMTDRLNKYIGLLGKDKFNAYILEFHNGCHNLSGVPFLKQSITIEKVQSLKYSLINLVRDFYITPELYQRLMTENRIIKTTIKEFALTVPTIGRLMEHEDDCDLWLVPIKKQSLILGCVILCGCGTDSGKLEGIDENVIELLKEDYINQK